MIVFREAKPNDYDAILELKIEVHTKHVHAEPNFYKAIDIPITREFYNDELKKNGSFVLEHDERIIGYVFSYIIKAENNPIIFDQKIFMVDDLCISEKMRNKGFGKLLMQNIENKAKEIGCTSVELNVWDFNEEAKIFYEKIGMKKTRIRMKKII